MLAYILDKYFYTMRIIDAFSNFVWNDVYNGAGDFEIEFVMDENGLRYIEEGFYVSIPQSQKIMIIEAINIKTSFEDGNHAIISGRSLESILERHIVRETTIINGNIQEAFLLLLNRNIISPSNPNRAIEGFKMKTSTDPNVVNTKAQLEIEVGENLYDVAHKFCEETGCGFRINIYDDYKYEFEFYSGKDRYYEQNENAWVVFSPKFRNLEESNMKLDLTNYRNTVEVDVKITYEVTVGDPETGEVSTQTVETNRSFSVNDENKGQARREIYCSYSVDAGSIDQTKLGTAEDRVNTYDYMKQEAYFDKQAYNEAIKKYNEATAGALARATSKMDSTVYKNVSIPDPDHPDKPEWLTVRRVVDEEATAAKRTEGRKELTALASGGPRPQDYVRTELVIDPNKQEAYKEAINKANQDIAAEWEALEQGVIAWGLEVARVKALQELKPYTIITSFDGTIDPIVNNVYGRDFYLGDQVQVVNQYDFAAKTRVVSVLFAYDTQNGLSITPTFESDDPARVAFDYEDLPSPALLELQSFKS